MHRVLHKRRLELAVTNKFWTPTLSIVTCSGILFCRSAPQATIWKNRKEWRYAERGTSGLFGAHGGRKCIRWGIYHQLGSDMSPYLCEYKLGKDHLLPARVRDYLFTMFKNSSSYLTGQWIEWFYNGCTNQIIWYRIVSSIICSRALI